MRTPETSSLQLAVAFSLLLPGLLFVGWIFRFAVNVPQWDDFSVLATLRYLKEFGDFATRLRSLLVFHNEHRIVYTRLVAWVVTGFGNEPINFRGLLFVGNASVLGLLWLLFASFRRSGLPAWAWVPVPFLLVQMQYFENCFFAMASLQNLTVWLWAGLSLRFLRRDAWAGVALGGMFALLSTGTSGNGLLVWGVGGALLVVQRRYLHFLVWGIVAGLVASKYLDGMGTPALPSAPLSVGLAVLGYLGAAVGAGLGTALPAAVGLVLVGLVVWAGWQEGRRLGTALWTSETGYWLAFAGFVGASAVAIALHRDPSDVVSISRYRIGSALMVVLTYLLTVRSRSPHRLPRWAVMLLVAGSVTFWATTYHRALPHVLALRTSLLQDAADFEHAGRLTNKAYRARKYHPEHEWAEAVRWDLYRF